MPESPATPFFALLPLPLLKDGATNGTIIRMTPHKKILDQMRREPANVRFNDLLNLCEAYFGKPRQSGGSHAIFKTPWVGDPRINIQNDRVRRRHTKSDKCCSQSISWRGCAMNPDHYTYRVRGHRRMVSMSVYAWSFLPCPGWPPHRRRHCLAFGRWFPKRWRICNQPGRPFPSRCLKDTTAANFEFGFP